MTLPPRVFCDTSFFYACLDPSDRHHIRAGELVSEAATSRCQFLTTWDVVSETATLLRYRCSMSAARSFLTEVRPTLHLVPYGDGAREEAEEIFCRYGEDRRLSFCDAISFVVVTTLLGEPPCLSFDRDFRSLGLTVLA